MTTLIPGLSMPSVKTHAQMRPYTPTGIPNTSSGGDTFVSTAFHPVNASGLSSAGSQVSGNAFYFPLPLTPRVMFGFSIKPVGAAEAKRNRMQALETEYQDTPETKTDRPLAVVEVGSTKVRALIRYPDGRFDERVLPIEIHGIGDTKGMNMASAIFNNINQLNQFFENQQIEASKLVGSRTLELLSRELQDSLKAVGIKIISAKKEADLLRQSVLREEANDPNKLVLTLGSITTKISLSDASQNIRLDIGAKTYPALQANPFYQETVEGWKQDFKRELSNHTAVISGKEVYIQPMPELLRLETKRNNLPKPLSVLSKEQIDFYQTRPGLDILKNYYNVTKDENAKAFIFSLSLRLAFFSAFMEVAGVNQIHIGHPGGLTAGLMQQEIAKAHNELQSKDQVRAKIEPMATILANKYAQQEELIKPLFLQYFNDDGRTISMRPKGKDSVADKLVKKIFKEPLSERHQLAIDISRQEGYAGSLIGDAIGARIVMQSGNQLETQRVVNAIEKAIREGFLEITEIHNYAGEMDNVKVNGQTTRFLYPYFTPKNLKKLLLANQDTYHEPSIKTVIKGVKDVELTEKNAADAVEIKTSGYTAVQMNVRFRDPVTKNMLGTGELQVRGKTIDGLAEVEHFIYDLLNDKTLIVKAADSNLGNSIERIKTSIRGINKKARENLTAKEVTEFYLYLKIQYIKARAKELGFDLIIRNDRLPKTVVAHKWLAIDKIAEVDHDVKARRHALAGS